MNFSNKISVLQMSCILMMTVGLANHVTMIPLLLQTAKRDSWLGVAAAFLIFTAWIWIPYAIGKRTNQIHLADWLTVHVGRWFSLVMQCGVSLYLFSIAIVALKETTVWTKVTYLPHTPLLVIVAGFLLLCSYTARKGIQSIAITAGLLLPFVIALGYFVMGANFQYKRYVLLFPLFTNDPSAIVRSALYVGGGLIELIMILFMQHHLKQRVRWIHYFILLAIMVGLTMGPLIGSIASFGPEQAAMLRYPAYEQWRLVQIGDYVAHVDFFSIYQWLSGSFLRVSLSIFLIVDVLKIEAKQRRFLTINLLCAALFIAGMLPFNDMEYLTVVPHYYATTFIAVLLGSLLLFAVVSIKSKSKGNNL